MLKLILVFLTFLFISRDLSGQDVPMPVNYSLIDSVSGDLDNDSKAELVVAYNTKKEVDQYEGVPRELVIYKRHNEKWTVWKRSRQALYGSRDGGMMGDPFGEMEIVNGILEISHNGGSSWKWGHTDKYRYQHGEFYLIGYASNYGKPCEYWTLVDFNLSTGKMVVKKEYKDCEQKDQEIYKRENETFYKKDLKITIQNRTARDIVVVTPKYKHEIYIATALD